MVQSVKLRRPVSSRPMFRPVARATTFFERRAVVAADVDQRGDGRIAQAVLDIGQVDARFELHLFLRQTVLLAQLAEPSADGL